MPDMKALSTMGSAKNFKIEEEKGMGWFKCFIEKLFINKVMRGY